jgi:tRNA(fMet)-specific endonuclease VapC
MTRYLFDSGILTAFIGRRNGVFEQARQKTSQGHRIGTCIPVLAEMVAGIERSSSRERNLRALKLALPAIRIWPFDRDCAFEYGRIHAELMRAGRPMQTIDIMIAAIALMLGDCTVVTTDSDLSTIPGLIVENWVTDGGQS